MHQLPHILPDYMLVFAVPVLTHDPTFTAVDDPVQLKQIEKCIWLILEPLITNKEFFCYGFYKNLCERMKNHKDAFKPDDEITNQVRTSPFSSSIFTTTSFDQIILFVFRKCGPFVTSQFTQYSPRQVTTTPAIFRWTPAYRRCTTSPSRKVSKTLEFIYHPICIRRTTVELPTQRRPAS